MFFAVGFFHFSYLNSDSIYPFYRFNLTNTHNTHKNTIWKMNFDAKNEWLTDEHNPMNIVMADEPQ